MRCVLTFYFIVLVLYRTKTIKKNSTIFLPHDTFRGLPMTQAKLKSSSNELRHIENKIKHWTFLRNWLIIF